MARPDRERVSQPVEPIPLRGIRVLALVGAVLTVFAALVDEVREAGAPLPMGERWAVAGSFFAFFVATHVLRPLTRFAAPAFRILASGVTLWTLSGPIRFGFTATDALGSIATVFVVGLLFPTITGLGAHYLLAGLAGAVAIFSPIPGTVDPRVLLGTLFVTFAASVAMLRTRDSARSGIAELHVLENRLHNGVVILDRAGNVRRSNEAFARLTGSPTNPGGPFLGAVDRATTTAETWRALLRCLTEGAGGVFELALHGLGSTPVWVAADLTPIGGTEEEPVSGFILILSDTTRTRAATNQIFDAMSDALLIVGGNARVESVNPAACRLLGAGSNELVGAELESLVVPDWRWSEGLVAEAASSQGSGAHLLFLLQHGELDTTVVEDLDLALRSRSGEVIPVLAAASVLPAPTEGAARLVLVARDARERRRLEEERTQLETRVRDAQKLESLGVLAGGIAHDFNNLLVGILGNNSLALEKLPTDAPQRPLLEAVDRSAQRAADLTRQMLAYAGKGQFVVEPVDVGHLVEEMSGLLGASLSKRAHLDLQLTADLPAVEGDAAQLRQLLMNLLTNASDALGDRDGRIRVSTALEVPGADPTGRHGADVGGLCCVCLRVQDDGTGMSQAVQRRIFDPFFTTKAAGRGLGLAATLGIARAHGGAIQVESGEGTGTRVSVWLPASARSRVPALAGSTSPPRAGLLLVVDDELPVREFIASVLEDHGFEVLQAADGAEGVAVVRSHATAIVAVILDLTMPVMGGDEALEVMRGIRPDLPVVLSSGFSEEDARKRFGNLGGATFLQKPYRAGSLLDAVRRVAPATPD